MIGGQDGPGLAQRIDRHLATGRVLYHAPLTPERLGAARQFVAQAQALLAEAVVARLPGDRDARLRMAARAFAQRLGRP